MGRGGASMIEDNIPEPCRRELPGSGGGGQAARAALQALSGAIPLLGGLLSAASGYWSEQEQKRVNDFLQA